MKMSQANFIASVLCAKSAESAARVDTAVVDCFKDRIASHILSMALRRGEIQPGGTVVEAWSGSTSIAMVLASAQHGLHFVAVMPEGVSQDRRLII